MRDASRTTNSVRNATVSLVTQIVLLILAMISRTIFVSTLGIELLGVNTLVLSLISVLSLADLGLNTAVTYAMFRPLADGDRAQVARLVRFARQIYGGIAGVVGCGGLALLPFLDSIVNTQHPVAHLHLYFTLLLLDVIASYLAAHRAALLIADQKMHLTKLYAFAFQIVKFVLQLGALLILESFAWYLAAQVVCTVGTNLYLARRTSRRYPFLGGDVGQLSSSARKDIFRTVRSMFAYRLGGVIMNQTDAILISILAGTAVVGYYANYILVVGSILTLTELVFAAVASSVGNLNATAAKNGPTAGRMRLIFNEIDVVAFLDLRTL